MPKALSLPLRDQISSLTDPSPIPNILKRNQACHQCRRRKLKCDARRPCSTCTRSHAAARASGGAASVPPDPECTYDEPPEPRHLSHDHPKNRYERLECRINELEGLLRQKESSLQNQAPQLSVHQFTNDALKREHFVHSQYFPETIVPPYMLSQTPSAVATPASFTVVDFSPNYLLGRPLPRSPSSHNSSQSTHNSRHDSPPIGQASLEDNNVEAYQGLFWPSWPARVPNPDLLMHLVDVFFTSLPHANRLLHRQSFVTALLLSPTDPGFPATSILHAICAVASLFTAAITFPPLHGLNKHPSEGEKYWRNENQDDSFGEMQAKYAKEAQVEAVVLGEGLFAGTQSAVILSWYHFYNARWLDVWSSTGEALRCCTPQMLNVCEPQVPLARSWKPDNILHSQSRTTVEEETRRNTFWLAYAMDRFHSSGTEFAIMLDDEDITQVLPCTSDAFKAGNSAPAQKRQRLTTPCMLTTHPPEQTDAFVLYIKAAVLLSKVKIFNQRYRAKYQTEPDTHDPRDTPAFKALDGAIAAFRAAFPSKFHDPLSNHAIDTHLYVAHLVPHTAVLLLHDPHADFAKRDWSCEKLTTAAHAIVDLVYMVCSTSYDISLLDPVVMWCWHWAARELMREMGYMQETGESEQVSVLRSEIEVIRLALLRIGDRVPLGYRQARILDELLIQEVSDYARPYSTSGLEQVDAGSLEQFMYQGMFGLR